MRHPGSEGVDDVRFLVMLLLVAVGCAADDGRAPDDPLLPIVQAAGEPFCTDGAQCSVGECVDNDCPDEPAHPCGDTREDRYNCGACGVRCPWGSLGAIWCAEGVCYGVGTVGGGG